MSVTYNQILSRWGYIRECISKKNYTLGISLSVCKPYKLVGDTLTLGFIFGLQKDQVDKPTNIGLIKEILLEEFGARLDVATIVDSTIKLADVAPQAGKPSSPGAPTEIKIEQQETNDPIGQVLDAFGGTVVEKI